MAAVVGMAVTSCEEGFDYDAQLARTDIGDVFYVVYYDEDGKEYRCNGKVEGDDITIMINPFSDVEKALSEAYPKFYMPMGATCSPTPVDPQDFTKEVKYTITSGDGKHQRTYTVNWGPSDPLPFGGGYAFSNLLCEKMYTELGYPGQPITGENGDVPNGDILFYPAFCGDKIVGFSRVYAWGNTNGRNIAPNHSLAFKVWDVATLEEVNTTLNLGSLSPSDIVNITNDWTGHVVAATGGLNSKPSELYYWTSLEAAPVKVGTLPVPVYTHTVHEVDASMFIQVAGDITSDAVVTYMPTKTSTGDHVAVNVRGGSIDQNYRTITTGYPSNDQAWFQMISMFGTDDRANYLVGETEGTGNGSVKAYYNTFTNMTIATMPAYLNGKPFSDGIAWWAATGATSSRGGSRRPFVMAMMVNGKEYSLVLTGYAWEYRSQMMTGDFSAYIGDALCYDMRKYQQAQIGSAGLDAQLSFGSVGCWYWDDDAHEGRVAIWNGREGLATFLISSYE